MYASTRQSPGEWQHSLLTCLLGFSQVGLSPARLKQEVSQTRHLIPLLQTFPCAIEACTAFIRITAYRLAKSPARPSTPEASGASLPLPLLRFLPGGMNQFPGGISTRCGPEPFHGAQHSSTKARWMSALTNIACRKTRSCPDQKAVFRIAQAKTRASKGRCTNETRARGPDRRLPPVNLLALASAGVAYRYR